jgi:hypothetical protein
MKMTTNETRSYGTVLSVLLAAWLGIVVFAASAGIFGPGRIPPPAAIAVPLLVFAVWVAFSRSFREYVLSPDVRTLTFLQAWRIIGFAFVIGGAYRILPNSFALPAGWGDVLVGLTAPLAALFLSRPDRARAFVAWQLLGMLDLVVAVTTAVLASGAVGPVAGGLTSRELFVLPYSLIPTFGVPMVMIFHIICLWQVAARRTAFANSRGVGHGVAPTLSPAR